MSANVGSLVRCDDHGLIRDVVLDGLDLLTGTAVGRPLVAILETGSVPKFFDLFEKARRADDAIEAELVFKSSSEATPHRVLLTPCEGGMAVAVAALETDVPELLGSLREQGLPVDDFERLGHRRAPRRVAPALQKLSELNNELAAAQRELSRKNRELEQTHHRKNELLGMVAHDLRNPLNAASISIEILMRSREAFTPSQYRLLETIRRSNRLMTDLVNDALDLSSIEAGHLDLRRTERDLTELIWHVVEVNRLWAHDKGIQIELHKPEAPIIGSIDGSKIEQVVTNLVSNALKYSPSGTRVDIRLSSAAGVASIEIEDQGRGITPDLLKDLFQPFRKGDRRGTGGESSTGLGLAIAQRIVEGHAGTIEVESELDRGSVFRVLLPLQDEPVAAIGPSHQAQTPS